VIAAVTADHARIHTAPKVSGSDNMKTRLNKSRANPTIMLYSIGRRDFFVLAFLVYALLGLGKLTLVHALVIAGAGVCTVVAMSASTSARNSQSLNTTGRP
jgi:hypothetical protein